MYGRPISSAVVMKQEAERCANAAATRQGGGAVPPASPRGRGTASNQTEWAASWLRRILNRAYFGGKGYNRCTCKNILGLILGIALFGETQ